MFVELTFINRTIDDDNTQIVLFRAGSAPVTAWRVFDHCASGERHRVDFGVRWQLGYDGMKLATVMGPIDYSRLDATRFYPDLALSAPLVDVEYEAGQGFATFFASDSSPKLQLSD